jgi:glycosyltransferase involved in cell wall biosynthesis
VYKRQELPESLRFHRAGFGGATPGHTRFFLETVSILEKLARKDSVRAVITRNIGFLPYLAYIRKRYRIPCFFETHDFFGDLAFRPDIGRSLNNRRKSFIERHALPHMDGIISLTAPQRDVFSKYYPSLPTVIAPTGLYDVVRAETHHERSLCYTGSLDPHKGLGLVMTALSRCKDSDIGLRIIGGKTEQECHRTNEMARNMGIGERVQVTPWVRHAEIGHLLDHYSAGIVPLRDTPFNRHLTSPLKILDCFSRCLPIIAADLPSIRAYVEPEHHGLLFVPDNPDSLAKTIDRFFSEGWFEPCSRSIEKDAPHLHWAVRGKQVLDFIDTFN